MSKALDINLGSQREIKREGTRKNVSIPAAPTLPVGRLRTNFYLPELNIDATEDSPQKSSPPVQKVVSRINKFIENIQLFVRLILFNFTKNINYEKIVFDFKFMCI